MNKLLNKSVRVFIWYAAIVLACSIPVYYWLTDIIWQHELNEHNRLTVESIKQNLQSQQLTDSGLQQSIDLWNKLRPETRIRPAERIKPDSIYDLYRRNEYVPGEGIDRLHGLVTYFEVNGKAYSVAVETNIEETHETVAGLAAVTILFFILLLAGFIVLNRRISARLWQPFYQTLQKIRSFDLHQQQRVVFEKTSIEEFAELNSSLDKLIAGSIDTYKRQKEFTENASHELQTPLAIIQFKLDLLLQNKLLTDEQYHVIEEIYSALSRVTRINKNLLLLAKIDNSQFPETETINLSGLVKDSIDQFTDFAADKQLHMGQQVAEQVVINGNKILVEILVTNLLLNAIRHSPEGSRICVQLKGRQLQISNSGSTALQSQQLFQRFRTASEHSPATGLGLAIVKEICNRYGWQVAYEFHDNQHVFSVQF